MEKLNDMVMKTIEFHVDRFAVIWHDGIQLTRITYREILEQCVVVYECLRDLSVVVGYVGVLTHQNLLIPTLVLGILQQNLGFVFIDPFRPKEYILKVIQDLNIVWIISECNDSQETNLKHLSVHTVVSKELVVHGVSLRILKISSVKENHDISSDSWNRREMAYAIQTSGTTGIPKIVQVPHKCIIPNIKHLRDRLKICETDIIYFGSPLTFDPCIIELFLALTCGASLLMVPSVIRASPLKLLEILFPSDNTNSYCGVTVIQTTPSLMSRWCLKDLQKRVLGPKTTLRCLLLGGEPCPNLGVILEWKGMGNTTQMFSLYGTTEVSCWASLCDIDKLFEAQCPDSELVKQNHCSLSEIRECLCQDIPLGKALMGTILEVRSSSGRRIESGEGELYIGSSSRICIIDDETEETFMLPLFRATGDVVRIHRGTGDLYFVGRKDDVIKRYGERVSLCEVEMKINSFPGVSKSCCIWDQKKCLLGVVVALDQKEETNEALKILKQNMSQYLPKAAFPDRILSVDVLPVTHHGKSDRKELHNILFSNKETERVIYPDSINEVLQRLWLQFLGVKPIMEDTFLQHGGHSLLALLFSSEVERVFGKSVPGNFIPLLLTGSSFKECCDCLKNSFTDCLFPPSNVENITTETEYQVTLTRSLKRKEIEEPLYNTSRKMLSSEKCFKNRNLESLVSSNNYSSTTMENTNLSQEKGKRSDELDRLTIPETASTLKYIRDHSGSELEVVNGRGQVLHGPVCNLVLLKWEEQLDLEVSWRYNLGKCVDASPCYLQFSDGRGRVVVGSHSHRLAVLDAASGSVVSECQLPDRIESSACISPCGNHGVVGCYDGLVYCVHLNSGSIVWSFKTDGMVKSSPALCLDGSAIIVGSYDHKLYCIDIRTGSLVWCFKLGDGSIFASPCVSKHSLVYIGTLNGTCAALYEDTGAKKWSKKLNSPIFSSPALLETKEAVLFAEVQGTVHCFSSTSGNELWTFNAGGNIFSSMSTYVSCSDKSSELIVFGCHDKHVYCLTSEVGNTVSCRWKLLLGSAVFSTPFVFQFLSSDSPYLNETVHAVVATTKGTIHVVDLQRGLIKSSLSLPHEVFSSPVVSHENLVVGCRDNYVYSLKFMPGVR